MLKYVRTSNLDESCDAAVFLNKWCFGECLELINWISIHFNWERCFGIQPQSWDELNSYLNDPLSFGSLFSYHAFYLFDNLSGPIYRKH